MGKKLPDPSSLEIPSGRWCSIACSFIEKLSKMKKGFDIVTAYVDKPTRRVHFIPSRETDTAVDSAKTF